MFPTEQLICLFANAINIAMHTGQIANLVTLWFGGGGINGNSVPHGFILM